MNVSNYVYDDLELKHFDYIYAAQRELKRIYGGDCFSIHNQIKVVFAEDSDQLIGCLVWYYNGVGGIWIQTAFTTPEHREKGILKDMLSLLSADNPGITLNLNTDKTNKRMQKVMEKLGWKPSRDHIIDYHLKP